jgi:hypothetical protein
MPKGRRYAGLVQAYLDAWIDRTSLLDDTDVETFMSKFAFRWGGLSTDAFKRTLQQGDAGERLFALFALGDLALLDGERLLIPFLDSPVRKERWASAISLGKLKNEQAFPSLLELLVEKLDYHPPSLTAGEKPHDPFLKQAWEKELDHKDAEYVWEYHWCLLHRLNIPLLLGSWGDARAIPALVQTFQQSLALEFHATYPNNLHIFSHEWHQFQDRLVYALGKLGAWHALDALDLPPKRMHIAQRYLVFGSFQASIPWVFDSSFLANWGKEGPDISALLARSGADLTLGLPDPEYVNEVLQERFALRQEQQLPSFHDFLQWHDERNDEWQDRWDTERDQAHLGFSGNV